MRVQSWGFRDRVIRKSRGRRGRNSVIIQIIGEVRGLLFLSHNASLCFSSFRTSVRGTYEPLIAVNIETVKVPPPHLRFSFWVSVVQGLSVARGKPSDIISKASVSSRYRALHRFGDFYVALWTGSPSSTMESKSRYTSRFILSRISSSDTVYSADVSECIG